VLELDHAFIGTQYAIADASGRLVQSGRLVSARTALELGALTPGMYQLVIAGDRPKVLRFLKD